MQKACVWMMGQSWLHCLFFSSYFNYHYWKILVGTKLWSSSKQAILPINLNGTKNEKYLFWKMSQYWSSLVRLYLQCYFNNTNFLPGS